MRVGFRRDVRVSWPGQANAVVARAVNLSPTGMLVDALTPTPCPVGSPVLCDVPLPRGSLRLRGRVAHRRVLSAAKVGMGIAFLDLSPAVAAELREVVDESEEKTQPLKLRFAGRSQVLQTRALPTADGFQFTTLLPFLRPNTEVDVTVSPDAPAAAKGWVSTVAFDGAHPDGVPRLVIQIRLANAAARPALETSASDGAAPTEMGALPERILESADFTATVDTPPGFLNIDVEESQPGVAAAPDRTEIVHIRDLRPRRSWRRAGILALGSLALGVGTAKIAFRVWPRRSPGQSPSAPAPVALQRPAPVAAAAVPLSQPVAPEPPSIEPIPAPPPSTAPTDFTVGLVGSLAGARRYPLRAPDGVAFNLPHAHATLAVGTYRPAVPGLRAIWVRPLPGGGTHLRFFFTRSGPSPEIRLGEDGIDVVARPPLAPG
jgi:hypothetical protein